MDGENNLPGKNHILPVKKKIGRPKLFWMAKKYLDDQKKFGRTDGIGIDHQHQHGVRHDDDGGGHIGNNVNVNLTGNSLAEKPRQTRRRL